MCSRPQRCLMMVNALLAAAVVGLLVLRSQRGSLQTALPEPVESPAPSTVVAPAVTETPPPAAPSVPDPSSTTVASPPTPQVAAELPAEEILRRADEVRNPQIDYTLTVTVTSIKPGSAAQTATYEVLVKGRDNTVIKTLSPRIDRGRVLLMKGRDLWVYLPTISKPLRISLRERLIGDVANGDLARANFPAITRPPCCALTASAIAIIMRSRSRPTPRTSPTPRSCSGWIARRSIRIMRNFTPSPDGC